MRPEGLDRRLPALFRTRIIARAVVGIEKRCI